jgi:hypothetical protein
MNTGYTYCGKPVVDTVSLSTPKNHYDPIMVQESYWMLHSVIASTEDHM